ncbi:prepilin-type N-terminal cleavage/methylation domain-containing protein [Nitrincola sp.]|uniref:prepilin-type N-terminal cleavage/methylation domain-containing protein n=1 Tax=Nitrincola sp. TaxID=1926584 RepID=UPI003A9361F3
MRSFTLSCHHQRGVGLPEVMITLLLLSSGSLALTQLQLRNLQTAYQSQLLTQQTLAHTEAVEHLWQQRCYLAALNSEARQNYLLQGYSTLFSASPDDPTSPGQLWQTHRPVTADC